MNKFMEINFGDQPREFPWKATRVASQESRCTLTRQAKEDALCVGAVEFFQNFLG
jgi:hypothetical protein